MEGLLLVKKNILKYMNLINVCVVILTIPSLSRRISTHMQPKAYEKSMLSSPTLPTPYIAPTTSHWQKSVDK